MKTVRYIFEGLDGVGKSTQLELLQARLEAYLSEKRYGKYLIVRYADCKLIPSNLQGKLPTTSELSAAVLNYSGSPIDLYYRHFLRGLTSVAINNIIETAEKEGVTLLVLLQDRGFPSTYAYQNAGGLTTITKTHELEKFAMGDNWLDLYERVFHFIGDSELFGKRVGDARDDYEKPDYLDMVAQRYAEFFTEEYESFEDFDASLSIAEISEQVFSAVKKDISDILMEG